MKKKVESLEAKVEIRKDAIGQKSYCGATTTATCHYNVDAVMNCPCGGRTTSVCKTDVSYN